MRVDYLATLCVVVQEGSLSGAARRLHLTQPAVSHQISAVERVLGCRIVDRRRKPVVLTARGRRVYPHIEAGVRAFRRAQEAARRSGRVPARIRVAAAFTFGENVLQHLVVRFRERHPSAPVSAMVGTCHQVMCAVLDGGADVGITFWVPGQHELPATLREVPLWDERLHLVVSCGHPWASLQVELPPERMAESEFILLGPETATRRIIETHLDLGHLRIMMEVGTNEAVRAAIKAGLGAGFVSEQALDPDLVVVPVRGLRVSRRLIALLPRQPRPSSLVREFLALTQASGPRADERAALG